MSEKFFHVVDNDTEIFFLTDQLSGVVKSPIKDGSITYISLKTGEPLELKTLEPKDFADAVRQADLDEDTVIYVKARK